MQLRAQASGDDGVLRDIAHRNTAFVDSGTPARLRRRAWRRPIGLAELYGSLAAATGDHRRAHAIDAQLSNRQKPVSFVRSRSRTLSAMSIEFDGFLAVDVRVGTVLSAEPFPEARKPAIKLSIDFGAEVGIRRTSAQITVHYRPDQLVGRQVMAVVNLKPKQIGKFISEVLILGVSDAGGAIVLLVPDQPVPNGGRMY